MVDAHTPQRIARLLPLTDALACIERLVTPLARTRAGAMASPSGHPPAAIALRHGAALHAEATLDASSYAPVRVEATPVETGDPLPAGTDAVAPVDAIELRGMATHVFTPLAPGDGVLPAGGDMPAGESLQRILRRHRAVDLAVSAILGQADPAAGAPRIRIAAARSERDVGIDAMMSRARACRRRHGWHGGHGGARSHRTSRARSTIRTATPRSTPS